MTMPEILLICGSEFFFFMGENNQISIAMYPQDG